MRGKRLSIIVLVVALVAGGGYLAHRLTAPRQPADCQICGRMISKQTEFRIETAHGTLYACCPRCAMHRIVNRPEEGRKEWATDFNSGKLILARSAYYDEGGDVQYCTRHDPAMERASGQAVQVRVFDRCLPVLVAFANKDDAESYRQKHGGRVVTFEQALEDTHSH